jgi:hypothetical protein
MVGKNGKFTFKLNNYFYAGQRQISIAERFFVAFSAIYYTRSPICCFLWVAGQRQISIAECFTKWRISFQE